jgi:hypothetical protein
MPWFSAIALFKHSRKDSSFVPQYEERISIVKARNYDSAEKKFLKEFNKYTDESTEFLNKYKISKIYIGEPGLSPIEVDSISRTSSLSSKQYIDQLWYGLKPKDCHKEGWEHCWYHKSVGVAGCYNCRKISKWPKKGKSL